MSLDACVLAGGRGERFWPLSRRDRPKQLANLTGSGTMIRLTVDRIAAAVPPERVLVVTSADLAAAVRAELPDLPGGNVVGEPVGRNSAPAIGLAAAWSERTRPGGVMLVAPSDHLVDTASFALALEEAAAWAAAHDLLLTFGITPTRADPGYGYIERGECLEGAVHRAVSFREKPDLVTARSFVESGRFVWNSGMFVWKASVLLEALSAHAPEIAGPLADLEFDAEGNVGEDSLRAYYEACPSVSIDYAVMERASNVAVLDASFTWCDVGSWQALGEVLRSDASGNVRAGRVAAVDCRDSVLYTDGGPIAAIGVSGLVVVRAGEVTMVCKAGEAERVRELVRSLGADPLWERYL